MDFNVPSPEDGKWNRGPTRPLVMASPIVWVGGLILLALLVFAACGGEEQTEPRNISAEIVTKDLAVGQNSFSVGLLDENLELVNDATVDARFFQVIDDQHVFRGAGSLERVSVELGFVHLHEDGSLHTHDSGSLSVYKAVVTFDEAGIWVVELTAVEQGKGTATVSTPFEVREKSLSPAVGSPAPRSQQAIVSDVNDISAIDTSNPPNPDMHGMTIADAVTSGRPTVILFATPGFCVSRVCGPAKGLVDALFLEYGERVNFVHVEPYFLEEARAGLGLCSIPIVNLQLASNPRNPDCPRLSAAALPPVDETWNLVTEPWIFVVDAEGDVAAKFEGITARVEIETALEQVLN